MATGKKTLVALCLICGLAQMPPARAQIAQLIIIGVQTLPRLIRSVMPNRNSQRNNQNYWGNNGQTNNQQTAAGSAQGNEQQPSGSSDDQVHSTESVHAQLLKDGEQKALSNAQQAGTSSSLAGNRQSQQGAGGAPFVMMKMP